MKKMMSMLAAAMAFSCGAKDEDESVTTGDEGTLTLTGSGTSSGDVQEGEGVDAAKMMVKVYALHASANEDCSDPVEVFSKSNSAAEYSDFLEGPTLGEGELALGEYPCVAITMSDEIKFETAEANDVCDVGEEYSMNVCRGGTGTYPNGDEYECTSGDDKVTLYLSTASLNTGDSQDSELCSGNLSEEEYNDLCGAWNPPSAAKPYRGFKIAEALEVLAATESKFIVDGSGKIVAEQGPDGGENAPLQCGMMPPVFSFE